jgi:glycyl-tRNA synthetase beta subunit
MPEKIHPEKTVKYKKKKTNENLQKFLEDRIVNIIENNIEPKMTKKDLINTIKKKSKKSDSMIIRRPKKLTMFSHEAPMELPIAKMFSIGKK